MPAFRRWVMILCAFTHAPIVCLLGYVFWQHDREIDALSATGKDFDFRARFAERKLEHCREDQFDLEGESSEAEMRFRFVLKEHLRFLDREERRAFIDDLVSRLPRLSRADLVAILDELESEERREQADLFREQPG